MPINQTDLILLTNRVKGAEKKIEHLDKAIRGNGEIGLNERVGTIEAVVLRVESNLIQFINDQNKYRLQRETLEAQKTSPQAQETKPRPERSTNRKGFKYWMLDKALPTAVGGVITSLTMVLILVLALTFSPAFQAVLDHAIGK